jgi:hypothetical protein
MYFHSTRTYHRTKTDYVFHRHLLTIEMYHGKHKERAHLSDTYSIDFDEHVT